jgi:hypothetical protein
MVFAKKHRIDHLPAQELSLRQRRLHAVWILPDASIGQGPEVFGIMVTAAGENQIPANR